MGLTSRSGSGSSITAHRLFAPGLALWFGALFGLSSLAVRTGLFEELVVASRLDQLVPAASPPLGHAARLLLALAFALVGGLIGWAMARLIANLSAPASDLDGDYQSVPYDPARPAVTEAAPYFAVEPAPAIEPAPALVPPAAPLAEPEPYQVRARDAHPDAPARRPILAREELREPGLGRPLESLGPVLAAAAPACEPPPPPHAESVPVMAALAPAVPVVSVPQVAEPLIEVPQPMAYAGVDEDEMPRMGPGRHEAIAPPPPPASELAAAPAALPPVAVTLPNPPPPPPPPPPSSPPLVPAARILEAAPASLSHVELIERLAIAMRRREAGHEQAPAQPPAAPSAPAAGGDPAAALRDALAGLQDSGTQ